MGAVIDKYTEQRIKDSADIVDVVRDFLELKKKGNDYVALCPFHDDKHLGSFFVRPRQGICTCYACHTTYDAIGFLMHYGNGMTYPEALHHLAAKYGFPLDLSKPLPPMPDAPKRLVEVNLPTIYFPMDWVRSKMAIHSAVENPLVERMRALPWDEERRAWLEQWLRLYGVGTSDGDATRGWTIWWQIDEQMRVHTGKLMKYGPDGHRDKGSRYNFNFIHSMMLKKGYWSDETHEAHTCLFGLHLLNAFPEAEVCLVESEKTAIIAQTCSNPGKKIFMATGSKGNLSKTMLKPIIDAGRTIVIYPDVDGLEEWARRMKDLGYERISISREVRRLYNPSKDDAKSDIADILIRMMSEEPSAPTLTPTMAAEAMAAKNPALGVLIEKLEMTPTDLRRIQL